MDGQHAAALINNEFSYRPGWTVAAAVADPAGPFVHLQIGFPSNGPTSGTRVNGRLRVADLAEAEELRGRVLGMLAHIEARDEKSGARE